MFARLHRTAKLSLLTSVWLLAAAAHLRAELVMKTEYWSRAGRGFADCDQRIKAGSGVNLLARDGAKVVSNSGVDAGQVPLLTDGKAGKAAAQGRVYINGQPSVITFYLGAPLTIHEVGVFTFNGDRRANQDFEVRFANNEKNPGKPPTFAATPHVSTGPHILGKDGGGYHTSFLDNAGAPLVPFKADWVEFRIWRTYNVRVGSPAKTKSPAGWTAVVELELLGAADDAVVDAVEAELTGGAAAAESKASALTPELRMRGKTQRPPRPPVYVKKETWQATMFASREAGIKRDAADSPDGQGSSALPGDAGLWSLLQRDFSSVEAQRQMAWERADSIWALDWKSGDVGTVAGRYVKHTSGATLQARSRELAAKAADGAGLGAVRQVYYESKALKEAVAEVAAIDLEAMRRAIRDLAHTFPERYSKSTDYLERLATLEKVIAAASDGTDIEAVGKAGQELLSLRVEALLTANPLIDFDKLLVVKRGAKNLGLPANWVTNASIGKTGYDNEVAVLSPVAPGGTLTTFHRPDKGAFVGDVDLHWDADRMMFSSIGANGRWQVLEMDIDPETGVGTGAPRQVNPGLEPDVDNFDPCYLPDGRVIFSSTRAFHGVPCVGGGSPVANLVLLDRDTGVERQLCFDQDQNWCPTVLNNGRVMYTRWEYSDTPHYFTRLLFHMNPDGTGQMEYAFSNSYWPNSTFYARPIPDHPTKLVAIVSGHHGVRRMGELIIYDPGKGRHEDQGTVQRIPGYGKPVPPRIADALVNNSWPRFLHPYPLSDKYFLVSCQMTNNSPWALYLVDVFDNMLKILDVPEYAILEPVPLRRLPKPPAIPDRVDTSMKTAVLHLQDVYTGPGLAGVPRGTVKKLRVYEFHFGYNGMGGHINVGIDGPWDVRRIRGTVPVYEDGSALFRVPANTPLAVQPLDAEGRALQVMRSWYTAMPGELATCIGCHEQQSSTPRPKPTIASTKPPSDIEPWRGPVRGFGFKREVQPVLDKYCVGCHDGKPRPGKPPRPNFADTGPGWRKFTNSYIALHPFVRRPGPESDYHIQKPLEWHASTSELVQILQKGHYGVKLDAEAWDRLVTWIDLNVPNHGTWAEHRGAIDKVVQRRLAMRTKYANCVENPEQYETPEPERVPFVKPPPVPKRKPFRGNVPGWPFDGAAAKRLLTAVEAPPRLALDLGEGQKLELVLVPAGEFVMGSATGCADEHPQCRVKIDKPFYMGSCEVTNAQYARFDPAHTSGVISVMNKDHGYRGRAADGAKQPVIRVSWQRTMAFCEWLSKRTGRSVSLPTEAQWEWACRAGTTTPLNYGTLDTDFGALANLADKDLTQLCIRDSPKWIPAIVSVKDGAVVTTDVGRYNKPNAWGLHDMHANVAEWTLTTYKPYPYAADGRDDGSAAGSKVVRGGSYYDRPHRARSAVRYNYLPWQCVHNVGFRVVCPVADANTVAAATEH